MIAAGVFDVPSRLLAWFYGLTHSYAAAIALIAVVVMVVTAPLTLKSTKGMLEMQKLAPEMRKLQAQYRNDRTKLNEEMMKLYQEHKVNPLSSCLPLLAQMPVFIIMFRVLYGLTFRPSGGSGALAQGIYAATDRFGDPVGFLPRYISHDSELFQSLVGEHEMMSIGLDLAKSPFAALGESFGTGLIYIGLVAVLGVLYFVQQRMVAARATVSPTMSPGQQKLMQYLPVAFAVFQVFFVLGLVIYYIAQSILRIGLQGYITRAFYGHDEALGRQAQRASEHARELAKQDSDNGGGGGGLFAQAKRELAAGKADRTTKGDRATTAAAAATATAAAAGVAATKPSKRTTEPKNRPTPSGNRPAGRPRGGRPGGPRSKSGGKRQR
jgi:YidC/Oxa1 family membrane protein insertase